MFDVHWIELHNFSGSAQLINSMPRHSHVDVDNVEHAIYPRAVCMHVSSEAN